MKIEYLPSKEMANSGDEVELIAWLVVEGDRVESGQPLVELALDKVEVEYPAPFDGVVRKLVASEGDLLVAGSLLCEMDA